MHYRVALTKQAEKSFALLMKARAAMGARVARAIDRIAEEPDIGVALRGTLKGLLKYRVGPYRIIYELRKSKLLIVVID